MKKTLFAIAMLAVAAGCVKEAPVTEAPSSDNLVTYTFHASLEDTKAQISNAGAFSWDANDEIAVYDEIDGKFYNFSTPSGNGSFSATLPEGKHSFTVAYYPASIAKSPTEVTLPSQYTLEEATSGKAFAMYAVANGDNLQFQHVGSLVRITVNDVPANATAITLTAAAGVTGDFTLADEGEYKIISAGSESSTITIPIEATAKQNITVTLPLPTGDFGFTVKVGDSTTDMLTQAASSRTFARKSLHKLPALTVSYPTTDQKLIGYFSYNSQDSSWSTSILIPFEPVDGYYGWLKAAGMGTRDTNKHVDFKLYNAGTYTGIVADAAGRRIIKTLSTVASSGEGQNITYYTNESSLDIYYNPTINRIFALPAGSDFFVPTVWENVYSDSFALIGSTGANNWVNDLYFEPVEADGNWRVIKNIAPNGDEKYSLKFRQNGSWDVQFGTLFSNNKTPGTVIATKQGGDDIIFNDLTQSYDIYISTDLKRFFTLPAGTPFSIPTEYDGNYICLIGYFNYDGGTKNEWGTDVHVSPVAGQPGWFVKENVTFGSNNEGFSFKFREPDNWGWTAGFASADTVNPNAWFDLTISNPQNCTINSSANKTDYDIYVKYDLSKMGIFEHGTAVTFPE